MNQKFDFKIEPERLFLGIIDSNNGVRPKNKEKKIQDETVCKICDKKLSNRNSLRQHMKNLHSSVLSKKVYFCDHCDLKFFKKNFLTKHLKLKHQKGKEIKFECDFDGKIFENKTKIYEHMKCHLGAKKCEICEKEFKSLRHHMRQVHSSNNEKVQCKICNKTFKNQKCLKLHLRSHNKQHQCQVCGRRFSLITQLKEHLRVHEDRFTFRCEKCQKNFSSLANLRDHLKTHDKNRQKQHKCQNCDYTADKKHHLTIHLRTHDAGRGKNLKCSKCDYKTDHKGNFKLHLRIHELNRVKIPCPACNYEATQRCSLTIHIKRKHDPKRIKNFKCPHCKYAGVHKGHLKRHIEIRHNKN